ncbi:hypothetical protein JB92DRAFT_3095784 [Gautieria morchelliformis]|nr:hypothetical protein JB92DRAFT_3095784 [Gautieria morchelliformis]
MQSNSLLGVDEAAGRGGGCTKRTDAGIGIGVWDAGDGGRGNEWGATGADSVCGELAPSCSLRRAAPSYGHSGSASASGSGSVHVLRTLWVSPPTARAPGRSRRSKSVLRSCGEGGQAGGGMRNEVKHGGGNTKEMQRRKRKHPTPDKDAGPTSHHHHITRVNAHPHPISDRPIERLSAVVMGCDWWRVGCMIDGRMAGGM